MRLTSEQVTFFKEQGYLILRGAMDPSLCAAARDRLWDCLPAGSMLVRDDPSTHIGPFPESETTTADQLNLRSGFRWQVRSVGTEAAMIDLAYSPDLMEVAEQLLGPGSLRQPIVDGTPMGTMGPAWPGGPTDPAQVSEGIRGIYCTLPYGDRPHEPEHPHTDGHPLHLGLVGLIDDVEPGGGAFKVWPGSHARLYPTHVLQYDQPRIPYYDHLPTAKGIIHTPDYLRELAAIEADTEPVDCHGSAGDVVLWHHRLAHAAGHNHSTRIRQAILADFSRTDLDSCRLIPPHDDMWHDWAI